VNVLAYPFPCCRIVATFSLDAIRRRRGGGTSSVAINMLSSSFITANYVCTFIDSVSKDGASSTVVAFTAIIGVDVHHQLLFASSSPTDGSHCQDDDTVP